MTVAPEPNHDFRMFRYARRALFDRRPTPPGSSAEAWQSVSNSPTLFDFRGVGGTLPTGLKQIELGIFLFRPPQHFQNGLHARLRQCAIAFSQIARGVGDAEIMLLIASAPRARPHVVDVHCGAIPVENLFVAQVARSTVTLPQVAPEIV